MYELKKIGKVFTSKFVENGPSSYEKKIYRAAVAQRLRNTDLKRDSIPTLFTPPPSPLLSVTHNPTIRQNAEIVTENVFKKRNYINSSCSYRLPIRSQWPRGLRCGSAAVHLLGLWVLIPLGAWMSVCCEGCVLAGRGTRDGLITRPEESYRLWCVVVCDLETSWMRRPWPTGGCYTKRRKDYLPN